MTARRRMDFLEAIVDDEQMDLLQSMRSRAARLVESLAERLLLLLLLVVVVLFWVGRC